MVISSLWHKWMSCLNARLITWKSLPWPHQKKRRCLLGGTIPSREEILSVAEGELWWKDVDYDAFRQRETIIREQKRAQEHQQMQAKVNLKRCCVGRGPPPEFPPPKIDTDTMFSFFSNFFGQVQLQCAIQESQQPSTSNLPSGSGSDMSITSGSAADDMMPIISSASVHSGMPSLLDADDHFPILGSEDINMDSDDDELLPDLICAACNRHVSNKHCICEAPLTRGANTCKAMDFSPTHEDHYDDDSLQDFGTLVDDSEGGDSPSDQVMKREEDFVLNHLIF
uniref:Uncharacterized protein n=1 Tax=Heterosigma akashiwo TaxID=2829 RepID=A0A6V1SER3_HETAK|mmetsp:Transcript_43596/g.75424  ORF Transcript_43596/g.75424 Transcript_43596/m.75424 type:complete len:283 (+) Transcript_43596:26-874(+)